MFKVTVSLLCETKISKFRTMMPLTKQKHKVTFEATYSIQDSQVLDPKASHIAVDLNVYIHQVSDCFLYISVPHMVSGDLGLFQLHTYKELSLRCPIVWKTHGDDRYDKIHTIEQ